MKVIQDRLRDHIVVVGYGTSGTEAVAELVRRGTDPSTIVVIDTSADAIDAAEQCGVNVLLGDATRNATLEAVQIGLARSIIIAAGRDDTTILIALTARGVAPGVPVSVIIRSQDNEGLAREAGATTVINPASFAGLLLAGSTQSEHLADYLADLANHRGAVALRERHVTAAEVGQALSAITTGLGVRIVRGTQAVGFWEQAATQIEPGDRIIEIVPMQKGR